MLSVMIAVDDEEEGLARTLASLVPAVVEGVLRDAVIIDSGGLPAVAEIADAAGCRRLPGPPDEAIGPALAHMHGRWVLSIEPGVVLENGWFREAAEFIERAEATGRAARVCAAFSYASQQYGAGARMVDAWHFVAANIFGQAVASQGLILARTALQDMQKRRPGRLPLRVPLRRRLVVLRARAFVP